MDRAARIVGVWIVGCLIVGGALILANTPGAGEAWTDQRLWLVRLGELALLLGFLGLLAEIVILARSERFRSAVDRARPHVHVEAPQWWVNRRLRLPDRGGKRRLRRETEATVNDIWTYVQAHTQPFAEQMGEHRVMSQAMTATGDESEKLAIWRAYTDKESERHQRERRDLAVAFGGRLSYLIGEYRRRGMLTESEARSIEWEGGSLHFIESAAAKLQALAMRL